MWRGQCCEGVRRTLGLGALGAGQGAGALLRGMRQREERGVSRRGERWRSSALNCN